MMIDKFGFEYRKKESKLIEVKASLGWLNFVGFHINNFGFRIDNKINKKNTNLASQGASFNEAVFC